MEFKGINVEIAASSFKVEFDLTNQFCGKNMLMENKPTSNFQRNINAR